MNLPSGRLYYPGAPLFQAASYSRLESRRTVNIVKPGAPIVGGMHDFRMTRTEQYYMHADPYVEVLGTTTFDGGEGFPETKGCVMPVVRKKEYVNGRIFHTPLGHVLRDSDVPEVLEMGKGKCCGRRGEYRIKGA